MDQQQDLLEERHSESVGEDLYNLIRPMTLDSEKMDLIWLRVQNIPYIFDDFTRGERGKFFDIFFRINTLAYEIGDFGIVYFTDVCPPVNACAHVIFWDRKFTSRTPIFKYLCEQVFDKYQVHRISSIVPTFNRAAILFAKRTGFHLEGVHREIVLSLGKWHDAAVLGLLRRDINGHVNRGYVSSATGESVLVGESGDTAISVAAG